MSISRTKIQRIKSQVVFDEAVSFDGISMVEFFMSYCSPCQRLKPILEKINDEFTAKNAPLRVFRVEIDDVPAMSRRFKVAAVPAIFFFRKGKESGSRMVGLKEKGAIVGRIEQELAKLPSGRIRG